MTDEIVFGTLRDALVAAVAGARRTQSDVWICRGEQVGCVTDKGSCADCYKVDPQDKRSIEDHIRTYLGGDA